MQHKHYFVALLCGALCLTGCLKNEESLSVAEVRNAKANELNASAELKKAQATAETVLANAQAELLKAQAEVEKAQATKIKAEADLVQVQADLLAVEVELAKVNVQSAKVALEEKKLELAAQEKALEVLIAECDAVLAQIAGELEAMQYQLEAEKYAQMLALAEAEEAYNDYLAGLDAEDEAAFQAAIAMYFNLQNAILEAQIEINENNIAITQLNALEDANYDALVDQYYELLNEEELTAALVAQAQQYIDKAEEYLEYDSEFIETALDEVNLALIDAYNDASDALSAYQAEETKRVALGRAFMGENWTPSSWNPFPNPSGEYTYRYSEYALDYYMWDNDDNIIEWVDYLRALGAYWEEVIVKEKDGDEIWAYQLGYDDENGEFVPLFTDQYYFGEPVFYDEDEAAAAAKDEATGVYGEYFYRYHYTVVPAETDLETLTAFVDAYVANEKAAVDEKKAAAKELSEEVKAQAEAAVEFFETAKAEYEAYIEAVEPKFEAAEEALEEAQETQGEKAEALGEAFVALGMASIDDHEVEEVAKVFRDAFAAKQEADQAVVDAQDALVDAGAALEDEEAAIIATYGGADIKEALFNRDFAIATAKKELKEAQDAITTAVQKAYDDAKKATEDAEKAVADAQKVVETTLAAYRAALIADEAASTEATQKKVTDTKKDYDDAKADLESKVGARNDAWAHYRVEGEGELAHETGDIAEDYNAKKNTITAKENALEEKQTAAAEEDEALTTAQEAIELAEGELEAAVAAQEDADEALAAAFEDFLAALQALNGEEMTAVAEAFEAWGEANTAVEEAEDAIAELEDTYWHYYPYKAILFAGDEEAGEDPSEFMQAYADAKEALETLPADYSEVGIPVAYEDYVEGLNDYLKNIEETVEKCMTLLKTYENNYRPAYAAGIEEFNKQDEATIKVYFDYATAQMYVQYLLGVKAMLVPCTFINEDGEVQGVEAYIAEWQEYIDGLYEDLQVLEDAFDDAFDEYQYDYSNIYQIERLTLRNEQLEACIAIWEIELEKYEEIINEWLAQNAA